MTQDQDEPKRFRSIEAALILALALAIAFNWQNLKSLDRWLFGSANRAQPSAAVPDPAAH